MLAHAAAQGAERHAFLGDYVGYGADPGWVVDRVREHVAAGAIAVLGNHDAAVVARAAAEHGRRRARRRRLDARAARCRRSSPSSPRCR